MKVTNSLFLFVQDYKSMNQSKLQNSSEELEQTTRLKYLLLLFLKLSAQRRDQNKKKR